MNKEQSTPLVSIIMAAYNYAHYIPFAIESVQKQTISNWELIVVDDGSTDATPTVVQKIAESDTRIRYHRQENAGQPTAENTGISLAKASLIAFLDADDAWMPDKLEKQLPLFDSDNTNLAVVYSQRQIIGPDGNFLPTPEKSQYRGNGKQLLQEFFRGNPVPFSSSIVRKEVLKNIGGFNPEYRHANDYDLWLRIAVEDYSFDYIPEKLLLYRTGHPNLTSLGDRQLFAALTIMERFIEKHPDVFPRNWVRQCFSATYCHLGMVFRRKSSLSAIPWYWKSFCKQPNNQENLGMILRLFLPECCVALVRSIFIQKKK